MEIQTLSSWLMSVYLAPGSLQAFVLEYCTLHETNVIQNSKCKVYDTFKVMLKCEPVTTDE
jgi:hypothetical protein